jgi:hypothetical protein
MAELNFNAADLENVARKLSAISLDPAKGLHDPFTRVTYQESLDTDRLQFPEQMLSLYFHPIYKELTAEQKWKLSLHETVNFFSINIHGERNLVKDIEDRLYVKSTVGGAWHVGNYLQHFIHEENSHTYMLASYCYRYADGVMKDYSLKIGDPPLSRICQDLLFFGRVFIFETFLDYLNCNAMRDQSLDTTVRQIHRFHHMEEARHMTFDRAVISYCLAEARNQGLHNELEVVGDLLTNFGKIAVQRLYSPHAYSAVGIENAATISSEARAMPERVKMDQTWVAKSDKFLKEMGLYH